jgi:hypothetical protein
MLRKLLVLLAAFATTLGSMVPTAGSASALGGEWLGCWATPGDESGYSSECWGGTTGGNVKVDFVVQDETAPSTYSWSVPAAYQSKITSGCSSTQHLCSLTVPAASHQISVSVTLTQGGTTATHTAVAYIDRSCGWWC